MKSCMSKLLAIVLFCLLSGHAIAQVTTTTVTVSSSVNPSVVGQQVTFSALITGTTATGTVQFMDGSTNLGTPVTVRCASGPCVISAATFQTSSLTLGSHVITAMYSGDNFNTSSSGNVTQVVLGAAIASTPMLSSWVTAMLGVLFAVAGGIAMRRLRR